MGTKTDGQGNETPVTLGDLARLRMRRLAVELLKTLDPAAYDKYPPIKCQGCRKGDEPPFAQRREAYLFAVKRAVEIGYKVEQL